MKNMNKVILVTGAAGFIGVNTCKKLLEEGSIVVGLDNLNVYYSPKRKIQHVAELLEYDNFTFSYTDLTEKEELNEVFRAHDIGYVVHLAARAGVRPSIEKPLWYKEANVSATLNLLELSVQYKISNFVYASSSSVYGEIGNDVPDENYPTDKPISPYAASKKSGELLCFTYSHLSDLNVTVLRFFNVYGPYGRPDTVLPKWLALMEEGKQIEKYGTGLERAYTYVGDIVDGIEKSLGNPHKYEIYNLGNSKAVKLEKVLTTLEEVSGIKAKVVNVGRKHGDVSRTEANIDKPGRELGWQPVTSFEDGVKKFVDWFREWKSKGSTKFYLEGVTKRILIFSKSYVPYVAGAEQAIKEISDRLDLHHYTMVTLRHDDDLPKEEVIGNIKVYRVGNKGSWSKVFFFVLALRKALGVSKEEEFNMTWANMTGQAGLAAMIFSKLKKIPYLLSMQDTSGKRSGFLKRWVIKGAAFVHAASAYLAEEVRHIQKGIRMRIIPNGVNASLCRRMLPSADLEDIRTQAGVEQSDVFLISVSPLKQESGLDILIEAVNLLPENYKLLIVGSGPEKEHLVRKVLQNSLEERVHFKEWGTQEDRIKSMQAADIFVRPARAEGLTNTFFEAMLCGTPVIGTEAGGLNEFLIHQDTALVVSTEDSVQIKEAIEKLTKDDELRERLVHRGSMMVRREHDWESVSEEMKKVFDSMDI